MYHLILIFTISMSRKGFPHLRRPIITFFPKKKKREEKMSYIFQSCGSDVFRPQYVVGQE